MSVQPTSGRGGKTVPSQDARRFSLIGGHIYIPDATPEFTYWLLKLGLTGLNMVLVVGSWVAASHGWIAFETAAALYEIELLLWLSFKALFAEEGIYLGRVLHVHDTVMHLGTFIGATVWSVCTSFWGFFPLFLLLNLPFGLAEENCLSSNSLTNF